MNTRRTAISCGANLLFNLYALNRKDVADLIVPGVYKNWSSRTKPPRPGSVEERDRIDWHPEDYDNKVYAGETVIFSDADYNHNAENLVKIIKSNRLGKVVSLSCINPNSKSKITTYLWRYNGGALKPLKEIRKQAIKKVVG